MTAHPHHITYPTPRADLQLRLNYLLTYIVDLGIALSHQHLRVLQHRHLLLVEARVQPALGVLRRSLLIRQEVESPVSLLHRQ